LDQGAVTKAILDIKELAEMAFERDPFHSDWNDNITPRKPGKARQDNIQYTSCFSRYPNRKWLLDQIESKQIP